MALFEREQRYLVLKLSDIEDLSYNWRTVLYRVVDEIGAVRRKRGARETFEGIDCVVIEEDWPEYETVWKMLEYRVAQEQKLNER